MNGTAFKYKNASSIQEFQKLMELSVINKNEFFLYNFTDDIKETDNHWWVDDDPRYQLLKEINTKGLITLNCEEGELTENSTDFLWRGSISFLLQKELITSFKTFFESKNFIFIIVDRSAGRDTQSVTLGEDRFGKIYGSSSYHTIDGVKYTSGGFLEPCEDHLNEILNKKIHTKMCEVHIVDSVRNRPVHTKDGLFTVLNYLI